MPTVAEWFLRSLIDHGCDAIFLNPGTDTPVAPRLPSSMSMWERPMQPAGSTTLALRASRSCCAQA